MFYKPEKSNEDDCSYCAATFVLLAISTGLLGLIAMWYILTHVLAPKKGHSIVDDAEKVNNFIDKGVNNGL